MNWQLLNVAVLVLTLGLAGCAPGPFAEPWIEARPLGHNIQAYQAPPVPTAPDPALDFDEPSGQITLRDAVAAALLNNPQLAAYSWEVRVLDAQAVQARLLPNPEIEVELEGFAGTGPVDIDTAETTVMLSQVIMLGGKIAKRTRVAELNRDLAAWDYETARLAVMTEVVRRVVNMEAAQRRRELAEKSVQLADQVYAAAGARFEAGAATSLERVRAGVVLETSRIALRRAESDMTVARLRLAALWGSTQPKFDRVVADLDTVMPVPVYERIATLVEQNPEIARWATEIRQRQADLQLAKAGGIPDVTAGAGIKYLGEIDETAGVVMFGMPLPIFDRNQGGILEKRYALAKARQQHRAAEVSSRTALAQAYHELAAAHGEATSLSATVLPAASEAYDATEKAYEQGKRSYLEVLDAQRSFFEAQGQYIAALATYHGAVAEVEALIGQSLQNLPPPPDQPKASEPSDAQPAAPTGDQS